MAGDSPPAPASFNRYLTPVTTRAPISPWATLAAILLGTFVGTLGNSVANVALPAVMAEFAVPLSSALWVVTLYTLLFAVLMPVCGYLGDLHGQRRMYLAGMALFTVASLGSGLAPSFPWLLGARALQGIAVAPTLPAVMAIISRTFSPARRGRAVGFWALMNGAGHALGPPLSGFLTQRLGWRAVFLTVVPLCFFNLFLVWWLVPPDDDRAARDLDFGGAATLTVAALGLMLALTQSARWGWGAPGSLGLWGLTLAALAAFLFVERRVAVPFVELALFANRYYAAATAVISTQLFCLFGLLLALPVSLIQVQGWGSQAAGLLVLPLPLTMAVVAPWAGRLADAWGSRWTCVVGMGSVALAGLAMLGLLPGSGQGIPWWGMAGCLVAVGTGMGLTQSPAAASVTHVVRREQLGVATGIFHMCRFVSGTLGSTVFGLILQGHPGGVAAGFGRDLVVFVVLAAVAVLAALGLPGRQLGPDTSPRTC
jgi:EmrB/QacA subfamily drug resistance transporter